MDTGHYYDCLCVRLQSCPFLWIAWPGSAATIASLLGLNERPPRPQGAKGGVQGVYLQ
ncbi:hypothetical protein BO94DRAFT_176755 [Aspergillus sclerotioniger CBS 115572]|uniref:Uncharacterized protein n=1 Tax=Aspergillus sclerotioniger CBS 115572 TaxID=1450535 RepID=A0A317VZH4_9EURO|nr:hypothetical protein BO94DRAFT_176755 [Aspergillus sclerotioniger CBS 115572]PWY78422.1 hypothetical protein BO94DRAFT_176755 [Aspergillus sclerotioniger CBS 115572]